MKRRGLSLIEVIVVMAIVAILIGLLIPAVQSVRLAAARSREANKLRQFGLAVNSFVSVYDGRLPNIYSKSPNESRTVHESLFPYLELGNVAAPPDEYRWQPALVRSEADPSFDGSRGAPRTNLGGLGYPIGQHLGDTSYAFNSLIFLPGSRLPANVPDGTSQTIAITHHYARCNRTAFLWRMNSIGCYGLVEGQGSNPVPVPCWTRTDVSYHLATLAEADMGDAFPYGVSYRPDLTVKTFQVQPTLTDCDFRVPQALFASGLMIAQLDGSVRVLSPGMTPETFWGAVTPAGGEILSTW